MKQKAQDEFAPSSSGSPFCGGLLVNHLMGIEMEMKGRLKEAATR